MINCVSLRGSRALTPDESLYFFLTSLEMSRTKKPTHHHKCVHFECEIRTEWKHGMIGMIGGTLFHGILESDKGTVRVEFILSNRDIRAREARDLN